MCWAQRITDGLLKSHGDRYDRITDNDTFVRSHGATGKIYQIVAVGVTPACRGWALGRRLVDRQIRQARSIRSIRRILGFTRPAGYHRFPDIAIESYVQQCSESKSTLDPVLSFHLDAGATIVSIHHGFRPDDVAAGGHAILLEYPV